MTYQSMEQFLNKVEAEIGREALRFPHLIMRIFSAIFSRRTESYVKDCGFLTWQFQCNLKYLKFVLMKYVLGDHFNKSTDHI